MTPDRDPVTPHRAEFGVPDVLKDAASLWASAPHLVAAPKTTNDDVVLAL